jgi:mannosyltransferase
VISHWPQVLDHPEALLRTPSVLAVTIAVWALSVWLARYWSPALVLATGVVLMTTFGFSRYGQEARPYGFVLLGAVLATILWSRLILTPRPRWLAFYAISIAFVTAANSLAATLVVAHVVAALATSHRGRRLAPVLRTPTHLGESFVSLFTEGTHPLWAVGALLPLTVLALPQVRSAQNQFIARTALAWALVPPAVLIPAVIARPNLLIPRYLLFVVPAWAILAGLGVVTLMDAVRWVISRAVGARAGSTPSRRLLGGRIGIAVAWVGAIALLTVTTMSQYAGMRDVRTPGGHGEDIRPALAMASTGLSADLPIVMSSRLSAVDIAAYSHPGFEPQDRLIGIYTQQTMSDIWPTEAPSNVRSVVLRTKPQIVLLMRRFASDPNPICADTTARVTPDYVELCMPPQLRRLEYHVQYVDAQGRGWIFALMSRIPTRGDLKPQKPRN